MRRRAVLAVAVLLCTLSSAAHATRVEKRWPPPPGGWKVVEVLLPGGHEACSLMTRQPPWGPAALAATIMLDLRATEFQFIYAGPEIPPVRSIMLFADKRYISTLPVLAQGRILSAYRIAAEMPSAVLRRRVLPALAGALALGIQAGASGYVILIGNVATLTRQLTACSAEIIARSRR